MSLRRWRDSLAPPLIAVLAAAAVVIPASASPARRLDGLAVRADAAPIAACRDGAAASRREGPAWYRLDPALDPDGTMTGWRFLAGRAAERRVVELALPVESFASGPRDGRVLVGADDGRRSTIRLVDVGRHCATVLYEGRELIRRAVLTPESAAIVEFRLDRGTRRDLGVWLRPLDGSKPRRIVEPLARNDRLGLVFSTALSWSADGHHLAAASCGEAACLTRIYDRRTGYVTTIDDEHVGEVIAVVGDELVAYGGCATLPCRIVARSLDTGRIRVLAERAGLASVAARSLAYEDYRHHGRVVIVGLEGGVVRTVDLRPGNRLVPGEARALAGIEAPTGSVPIAPDGRPSVSRRPATFMEVRR
jgi:hypothetical protein